MNAKPFIDANAVSETVAAVRENPKLAQVSFTLESSSLGGLRMQSRTGALHQAGEADESRTGKFSLQTDEPVSLLGTDQAVSPAEYVLQALAGCYGVTLAACASAKGIELNRIDLDLQFDIDLQGFLGVDDTVRPGAQEIKVKVHLDSPNTSPAELEELIADLQKTSPIRDTLANPVKVTTQLA
ncbi:MAG: OsmC family protein [Proteobacteria bacterium]|nr:OsmC family protein [Pseudomonadota bacterium]